jgi:hypothetical protein
VEEVGPVGWFIQGQSLCSMYNVQRVLARPGVVWSEVGMLGRVSLLMAARTLTCLGLILGVTSEVFVARGGEGYIRSELC